MLKQPLRPPPRQPREAKRGQVPCRARRHPDLRLGFAVAWIRSTPSRSPQRWPLVSSDRLNGPRNRLVRLSLTKQHRTTPLLIGALACHHAITCGLGLLLRNAGGDLRFLAIDAAKADIAISPSWPRRERSQFTYAIARPSGLSATSAAPPRNEKPNFSVRFKSQPRCSVIRRGLARQVGSTGPAARRTTRRRPRSHRP